MITSAMIALKILASKSKNKKPYINALKSLINKHGVQILESV